MRHQVINPEVASEAEWLDGIVTLRDLEDIAARRGVSLYVEAQRRPAPVPVPVQRRALDASALAALSRGEDFAQRERERQVREGAFRLLRLNCRLAARRYVDSMEAGL